MGLDVYNLELEPGEISIVLSLILISLGNCMISSVFREQTCRKIVKMLFCERLQRLLIL